MAYLPLFFNHLSFLNLIMCAMELYLFHAFLCSLEDIYIIVRITVTEHLLRHCQITFYLFDVSFSTY